jgi:hypothetical protein
VLLRALHHRPFARKLAINHEARAFTENKRYPAKPPREAGMVNQNAASVYQSD